MPCADPTWLDFQQTTTGVSSTNTLTSITISPPGGALLIVRATADIRNPSACVLTIADTLTGTGTWTEAVTVSGLSGSGNYRQRTSIFTAVTGNNPGSGTITVTRTAGSFDQWFSVEYGYTTGQASGTYLGATGSNVNIGTGPSTLAVTLSGTPANSSLLVGGFAYGSPTASNTVTPPSGWTEQRETFDGTFFETHETAWKNGSGSSSATWTFGTQSSSDFQHAVAIEILASTPPPIANPTWVDSKQTTPGTSATNTLTSGSFAPPAGALLIVAVDISGNNGGVSHNLTVTDTFTGTGSWTRTHVEHGIGGGSYVTSAAVFIAVAGASPGSGTITVTRASGTIDQWMVAEFGYTTGQAMSPLGATGTGDQHVTSPTTLAVTLSSAPASDSLLVGTMTMGSSITANQIDPPSGWTEQRETVAASSWGEGAETAWKNGSGSTTSTWTLNETTSADTQIGVIVEILSAPVVAARPPLPLRGPGSVGRFGLVWQPRPGNVAVTAQVIAQDMGTVTQTQTPTQGARTVTHLVPLATETQTLTLLKSVAHAVPALTETQTPSSSRSVLHVVPTQTETQTPSLSATRAFLRTLSATQTQTISFVRQVLKNLAAGEAQTASSTRQVLHAVPSLTETQTPTITKSVGKPITALTETQTPSLAASKAFLRTLSVTAVQTISVLRQVGKNVSATQVQTVSAPRQVVKPIAPQTETQTPTMVRSVGKPFSLTQVQTVSLAASKAFLRTLSVTQTQTVSVARSVGKVITRTAVQTLTAVRQAQKAMTAGEQQTPSVTKQMPKTFTRTQTQTPTLAAGRLFFRALTAVQTQTPALLRSTAKVIAAVAQQAVSLAASFIQGVIKAPPFFEPMTTVAVQDGRSSSVAVASGQTTTVARDDGERSDAR